MLQQISQYDGTVGVVLASIITGKEILETLFIALKDRSHLR